MRLKMTGCCRICRPLVTWRRQAARFLRCGVGPQAARQAGERHSVADPLKAWATGLVTGIGYMGEWDWIIHRRMRPFCDRMNWRLVFFVARDLGGIRGLQRQVLEEL